MRKFKKHAKKKKKNDQRILVTQSGEKKKYSRKYDNYAFHQHLSTSASNVNGIVERIENRIILFHRYDINRGNSM